MRPNKKRASKIELSRQKLDAITCSAIEGSVVGEALVDALRSHGDTYRAIYTVTFKDAVYVLHVFQKKSRVGIATSTSKSDIDLIRSRYRAAEADANTRAE